MDTVKFLLEELTNAKVEIRSREKDIETLKKEVNSLTNELERYQRFINTHQDNRVDIEEAQVAQVAPIATNTVAVAEVDVAEAKKKDRKAYMAEYMREKRRREKAKKEANVSRDIEMNV
jgi:hypothetical protein